ncbi:MAG: hypothetical protein JWP13_133 [Candidatus Saccharibacteria bacterium]|nr:hypothetical protein [Candidatus Saccharibacteria bacterium]
MSASVGRLKKNVLLQKIQRTVYSWLDARPFFYVILGLLVFQSLWIALSAVYPQAFDENYHFGLIQLHAQQWLPFFTAHPAGAEVYGAVSRDPSYLFHYLLSLPYQVVAGITDSLAVQVIVLRLLNIGMFVGGLLVYRKVLLELGISRRLMHVVLLFFVLTPVVPLLAAQINYDNLIFMLTALLFLYAIRYMRRLYSTGVIDVTSLLLIVFYILFTAVVKYTSTPLSLALAVILATVTVRQIRKHEITLLNALAWPRRSVIIGFTVLLLGFGGLFAERYAVNLAAYHGPVPDCAKVLTIEQCQSYSPWARDHLYAQSQPKPSTWGLIVYPFVWVHRMVFETMFVISSRFIPNGTVEYIPAPPLTVANYTAWTIVITGAGLAVYYIQRLWRLTYLRLLLLAIAFYTAVLFIKNLSMYLHTGEAMAIHGRYLVPVYPILYAALALPFAWAIDKWRRPEAKTWLVVITLVLLVHGVGLIAWLYRSEPRWYWSSDTSSPAYQINHMVQGVLHRVIIP